MGPCLNDKEKHQEIMTVTAAETMDSASSNSIVVEIPRRKLIKKKNSKSRGKNIVINVKPYGINTLEKFLDDKINQNRRTSQGT